MTEIPVCKIEVKGKSEQITIKKGAVNLKNNNILLLRSSQENISWLAKVSSHGYSNYIRLTSNLKQRPTDIEVIKIAKVGERPPLGPLSRNQVDILNFINDNCTCIERPQGNVSIYKPPKGPSITIKRIINLDEDLAWSIGFYLAEGPKVSYGVGITNHELYLLKHFQESIEKNFDIQNKEWFVYIHSRNKDSSKKFKSRIVRIFQTNKISDVKARLATKDTIELKINNTLFAIIFNQFVSKAIELILEDTSLALAFLKGYEIGDGCILQRNSCYLYGICITTKNNSNKEILVKTLQKLYNKKPRIRSNKGCYEITCTGINLMTEFILDEHFSSSPKQWKKIINSYLKKQYTRSHIRYWLALKNKKLLTREMAQIAGRSYWSVLDAMNKDAKLGLIKTEKRRFPNKAGLHNIYSLTNKGDKLLSLIGGVDEKTNSSSLDGSWGKRQALAL